MGRADSQASAASAPERSVPDFGGYSSLYGTGGNDKSPALREAFLVGRDGFEPPYSYLSRFTVCRL